MDKLKPVIEHHFWIVCGVVLILPLVGWWPAVGQFNAEREQKISEIETAFSQVPNGPQPNESWSVGVNKIAEVTEEKNAQERYDLWRRQEKMMTWPNRISRDLRPTSYMGEIPSKARVIYRNGYLIDVKNLWKTVDPFDPQTGKGTVVFPEAVLPRVTFGDLPPTTEEVWEAQEDLWLLQSLLKSIRSANSDANTLVDSLVRKVSVLKLVGGEGNYPDAEPVAADEYGMSDEYGMDEYSDLGMDPGMDPSFGEGMAAAPTSAAFDPSDEFGVEQGRYIDYEDGTVFKKRGFYMEAVIEHQRLPELLVELTNGDWPVSIVRVQMAQTSSASTLLGNQGEYQNEYSSGGNPFSGEMTEDPSLYNDGGSGYDGGTAAPGLVGGTPENLALAKAATSGPSLAQVAISGMIFIYNPVEPPAVTTKEAPATPAAAPATTDVADPTTTSDAPATTDDVPLPPVDDLDAPEMEAPEEPGLETPDVPADELTLETPAETPAPETPAPETPETETPEAPALQ